MELSGLTIKIIILLIPGFISYFIYKRITSRATNRTDLMFIAVSALLGILSYVSLQLCSLVFHCIENVCSKEKGEYPILNTFKLISTDTNIPYSEVIFASIFGIIIAYFFTYIDTNNIINRFACYIKVSTKKSDENLFSLYLNSVEIEWVYIRDIENKLTYLGSVFLFSEKDSSKEIVLNDVTIYSYPESRRLYELPSVYLCLKNENIIIEQANIRET